MTIDDLNSLDRENFVNAIGWVFEHSPWVAERAWSHRPFRTIDALHRALVDQVEAALPEEQLTLLRAHPDLGARARVAMSEASTAEQAGAGLNQMAAAEFERLQRLNTRYRDKFGFPFLFAVKGSSTHDILRALAERVESAPELEYREAMRQVYRIARFRLEDGITSGDKSGTVR